MTTSLITQEEQVNAIISEAKSKLWQSKSEIIKEAATKLEPILREKRSVCAELVHGLKGFVNERTIRRALGPEYTREYLKNKDESDIMSENEDKKVLEEEGRKLREDLGIADDEEPNVIDDAVVHRLEEKLKIMKDERDYYRQQFEHFKALAEARQQIGDLKIADEIVLFADQYEDILAWMKKSPNGIVIKHDGYNVGKFKALSTKKPTNPTTTKEKEIQT